MQFFDKQFLQKFYILSMRFHKFCIYKDNKQRILKRTFYSIPFIRLLIKRSITFYKINIFHIRFKEFRVRKEFIKYINVCP